LQNSVQWHTIIIRTIDFLTVYYPPTLLQRNTILMALPTNPTYHATALPITATVPRRKMIEPEQQMEIKQPLKESIPLEDGDKQISISTLEVCDSNSDSFHKRPLLFKNPKKIEFKTPDGYQIVLENKGQQAELLKVMQEQTGHLETLLSIKENDPQQTEVSFIRLKGQDQFQFKTITSKQVTIPNSNLINPISKIQKNMYGETIVIGETSVKDLPAPVTLVYSEEGGKPIVKLPLFSLGNVLALTLDAAPRRLILRGTDRKYSNSNTESLNQQWQPYLEVTDSPQIRKRHDDKIHNIQIAVEDWYQQVHPDLLLKQANALPIPTPESLGIKIAICPEDAAPATALPTNPAKN